ncbi:hypothetical protein [Streptomyces rubiginosohelvolus]|uniref:hypothetical protein n=1 Tax=Streptomyces rubiginosohelvolus TaxID=67362 RepID=UPI00378A6680
MGICIDVLIVDWDHLMAAPSDDQRYAMLHDAGLSVDDDENAWQDRSPSTGPRWFWPSPPAIGWFGKFDFGEVGFSYKDHFVASEQWEEIRAFVAPEVRSVVDRFLDPLFWGGLEYMADRENAEGAAAHVSVVLPDAPSDHLLWCPPSAVSSLKLLWDAVDAELTALRKPFEQHASFGFGRVKDFDAFAGLLHGWGDVISQALQRGWGVVGLRC